jgi:hypothetical protein
MISSTGNMTAFIAVIVMALQSYKFNHFCDDYDTSNNHTILVSNELFDDGDTTSQEKYNGAICFSGAIPAVCLVFVAGLIQSMYGIGSR